MLVKWAYHILPYIIVIFSLGIKRSIDYVAQNRNFYQIKPSGKGAKGLIHDMWYVGGV